MKRRSFTSSSKGLSDLRRFAVKVFLLGFITLLAQLAVYPYQQKYEAARKIEAEERQRSLEKLGVENQSAPRELTGEIEFAPFAMDDIDPKEKRQLDFLLIGDSTIYHFGGFENGNIDQTTWQLLEEKLPGCTTHSIKYGALNFVMYDLIVQYFHEKTDYINTVIIPLNVRSFGASWFYNPAYQFERMRTSLILGRMNLAAFEKPAQITKMFQTKKLTREDLFQKEREEWADLKRREEIEYGIDGIVPFKRKLDRIMYNFEIDSTHPLLRALDSLVNFCQESDIRLILYAIPNNFEFISNYHGDFTAKTTRQNLKFLADYCEESGIELLDFTDALPVEEILIIGPTAGHLRGTGREHLAQLIADELHSKGIVGCVSVSPGND